MKIAFEITVFLLILFFLSCEEKFLMCFFISLFSSFYPDPENTKKKEQEEENPACHA